MGEIIAIIAIISVVNGLIKKSKEKQKKAQRPNAAQNRPIVTDDERERQRQLAYEQAQRQLELEQRQGGVTRSYRKEGTLGEERPQPQPVKEGWYDLGEEFEQDAAAAQEEIRELIGNFKGLFSAPGDGTGTVREAPRVETPWGETPMMPVAPVTGSMADARTEGLRTEGLAGSLQYDSQMRSSVGEGYGTTHGSTMEVPTALIASQDYVRRQPSKRGEIGWGSLDTSGMAQEGECLPAHSHAINSEGRSTADNVRVATISPGMARNDIINGVIWSEILKRRVPGMPRR